MKWKFMKPFLPHFRAHVVEGI